jgi:hypothetical protein
MLIPLQLFCVTLVADGDAPVLVSEKLTVTTCPSEAARTRVSLARSGTMSSLLMGDVSLLALLAPCVAEELLDTPATAANKSSDGNVAVVATRKVSPSEMRLLCLQYSDLNWFRISFMFESFFAAL